jgi:hypothetical protein
VGDRLPGGLALHPFQAGIGGLVGLRDPSVAVSQEADEEGPAGVELGEAELEGVGSILILVSGGLGGGKEWG